MKLGLLIQMLRFQNSGQTLLGQIQAGGRASSQWFREDGTSKADVEKKGRRRAKTDGQSGLEDSR